MTASSHPTILVLAYYYPPDNTSGVFRTLYFFNHIARHNRWNVHVLTLAPKYYRADQNRDELLRDQVHSSITVTTAKAVHLRDMVIGLKHKRSPSGTAPLDSMAIAQADTGENELKTGCWSRFKDFVTDDLLAFPDDKIGWLPFAYRMACRILAENRIDLIYSTGSPWTSHVLAWLLKKKIGLPLVLDYRDPWHGNPYESTAHSNLYTRFSFGLEKKIISAAERVLCNTRRLRLFYTREFGCKEKFITLPNGYEVNSPLEVSVRQDPDNFVIVHAGSLYGGRNPDNFLHAVTRIIAREEAVHLRIILVGAGEDVASHIARDFPGLQDVVEITPRVDHDECMRYLLSADLLLLFQQGTELQVPRKLYEYIGLRKPILGICDDGETFDIIQKYGIGIAVHDRRDEIQTALEAVLAGQLPTTGSTCEHFDNRRLAERLEAICTELLAGDGQ